jgi:DNA adenine methylase
MARIGGGCFERRRKPRRSAGRRRGANTRRFFPSANPPSVPVLGRPKDGSEHSRSKPHLLEAGGIPIVSEELFAALRQLGAEGETGEVIYRKSKKADCGTVQHGNAKFQELPRSHTVPASLPSANANRKAKVASLRLPSGLHSLYTVRRSQVTSTPHAPSNRYASPLRYPGGKGSFADLLRAILDENFPDRRPAYAEPFAGGAGAALRLLYTGAVDRLLLNDADRRIYCFWKAVTAENARFCDLVQTIPLTIDEWKKQKLVCSQPKAHNVFEVGFSAFFLNRCNRSGVIRGAGPIGGYAQSSALRIDARFNRSTLASRLQRVGEVKSAIHLSNLDAMDFLVNRVPKGRRRAEVFVYLDPPYVGQGRRLYMNRYQPRDHRALANYLKRQNVLPWVASYDDSDFIRSLYNGCAKKIVSTWYSMQNRVEEGELLLVPKHIRFPKGWDDMA